VDFLPQMGTEDLNEGDLEGWNFAMQEDTSQIKLDLETNVNIGAIDLQIRSKHVDIQ
jgi:hypothetical protein